MRKSTTSSPGPHAKNGAASSLSNGARKDDEWNCEATYKERMIKLLETGYQSDFTLVVGSREIKVHKIFLLSGSKVFQTRIQGCSSDKLVLDNCAEDPEIFRMFLKYFYTGQIENVLTQAYALQLLQLAAQFEVVELMGQCAAILKANIAITNVIEIFNQAMLCAHKDLIRTALNFICRNGHDILSSESFNQLRLDGLVEILQQDNLRVKGEIDVFNAVCRWGEAQLTNQDGSYHTSTLKSVLEKPLKYIRFPLMDSKDFGRIVAPKRLLDSEETISLLTSFLLPVEERGTVHGGWFSTAKRTYIVDDTNVGNEGQSTNGKLYASFDVGRKQVMSSASQQGAPGDGTMTVVEKMKKKGTKETVQPDVVNQEECDITAAERNDEHVDGIGRLRASPFMSLAMRPQPEFNPFLPAKFRPKRNP